MSGPYIKEGNQGNDGVAHMTYFDYETQWSFVWDGTQGRKIQISEGGYAEEPRADLYCEWPPHIIDEYFSTMSALSALHQFQAVCQEYVSRNKNLSSYI